MAIDFHIKNNKKLQRVIIFIVAFVVIFISFPDEKKFRFEFKKGTPWQHEDLFAPFKFSIYKLPDELQAEIDSTNQNLMLYYNYDKSILDKQIQLLNENFENSWNVLMIEDSIKRKNDPEYKRTPKLNKKRYKIHLKNIEKSLNILYDRGTYEPLEVVEIASQKDYKLVFEKNGVIETFSKEHVFTLKSGYKFLYNNFLISIENTKDRENYLQFFKSIGMDKFVVQNLTFDKQKTDEIKNLSLRNISKTCGFIQTGERIISKGEVITIDEYRILESLRANYEQSLDKKSRMLIQLGNFFVIFLIFFILVLYIKFNRNDIYNDTRATLLIYMLIIIFVVLPAIIIDFSIFNIYIFPIALLSIIIKTFFDQKLAMFISVITITLLGFIVPNSFEFIVIEFVASFASVFGISKLHRRGQLYISAASVLVAMCLMYFGIAIVQEGRISEINWIYFVYFGLYSLLLLSAYPLIYAFEKIFGFISDLTLLELSTTNHPLLQKLATTAPGTFQHSLQVSNLAAAAANKIGANSMLVKVGALYHDIGKIAAPAYFIENQVSGFNPHDQIEFDKSAEIIIKHVTHGITIANKNGLPQQVIDFIRTHHGTTTTQYFYKNYIKKYPDRENEIETFTYPGPKPFSKETAILMMADSIEAASRSLKTINQNTISGLINGIIDYQMNEKQFEDANITFKEISEIKKLFIDMLLNIYHARIEYPK